MCVRASCIVRAVVEVLFTFINSDCYTLVRVRVYGCAFFILRTSCDCDDDDDDGKCHVHVIWNRAATPTTVSWLVNNKC